MSDQTENDHEQQHDRPEQEESLEAEDVRLHGLWDLTMKDKGGNGLPHRKTAVLLLAWDASIDELGVKDEVKELEGVFKNIYNYTVRTEYIKPTPHPQHQVSVFLANFVFEFDGKDTLLIVYYAGHGSPGNSLPGSPGDLYLRYETTSQQPNNNRNSILWHKAEQIITETQADVLVIFDCCYAGNLAQTRGHRSFEFLGATDHKSTTNGPGPTSFTSALIWSLKALDRNRLVRPYFTTSDLYNKIGCDAPRFPKQQRPFLTPRHTGIYTTRLVLARVPRDGESETIEYGKEDEKSMGPKLMVDLRLCFVKKLQDDDIIEVAGALKTLIDDGKLSAQRVQWRGYGPFPNPEKHAHEGAQWWLQKARRRRAGTLQGLTPSSAVPIQEHNPPSAFPLTPPYSEFGDSEGPVDDGLVAEAKSGTLDTNGVVKLKDITLHSAEGSKGYDQHEIFRVPQPDGLYFAGNRYEGLAYHFKALVIGVVNVTIEAFRQPEFRLILMVGLISLAYSILEQFLVGVPVLTVIPVVRVFVRG